MFQTQRFLNLVGEIAPEGILLSPQNQEMISIELSNWEWILIITLLVLLVWVLIVFQARQRSSHEIELSAEVDHSREGVSHSDDQT